MQDQPFLEAEQNRIAVQYMSWLIERAFDHNRFHYPRYFRNMNPRTPYRKQGIGEKRIQVMIFYLWENRRENKGPDGRFRGPRYSDVKKAMLSRDTRWVDIDGVRLFNHENDVQRILNMLYDAGVILKESIVVPSKHRLRPDRERKKTYYSLHPYILGYNDASPSTLPRSEEKLQIQEKQLMIYRKMLIERERALESSLSDAQASAKIDAELKKRSIKDGYADPYADLIEGG